MNSVLHIVHVTQARCHPPARAFLAQRDDLVERWFSELTTKNLRRGTHRTVRELNTGIRAWISAWNDNPRPYVWTKTADQILDSIARYCTRINAHDTRIADRLGGDGMPPPSGSTYVDVWRKRIHIAPVSP